MQLVLSPLIQRQVGLRQKFSLFFFFLALTKVTYLSLEKSYLQIRAHSPYCAKLGNQLTSNTPDDTEGLQSMMTVTVEQRKEGQVMQMSAAEAIPDPSHPHYLLNVIPGAEGH